MKPMSPKGWVRLYALNPETGEIFRDTGFRHNLIVETGREFILDEICNNEKWNAGAGILAAALGTSTNNIDGLAGPSQGVSIAITDDGWNDVVLDDWRLYAEMCRSSIVTKTRDGNLIVLAAAFTNSQFTFNSGICKIREAGTFLNATTPPVSNPQSNPSQKPYAMVSRCLYYGYDDPDDPTEYVDQPYYVFEDGLVLMYEYKLEM